MSILGSVAEVEEEAFSYNQLHTVTLQEGVKAIGEYAFYKNQLTELAIPDSVIWIKRNAFKYNAHYPVIGKRKKAMQGLTLDDTYIKIEKPDPDIEECFKIENGIITKYIR